MGLEIDFNLVLTLWTSAALPLILTYLAYRLARRSETRGRVYNEKKRVYGRLEEKAGKLAQGLTDFRALQLMRIETGDIKDFQSLFLRLTSLPSVLQNGNCIDILHDYMEGDDTDDSGETRNKKIRGKDEPSTDELKAAFEEIKARVGLEMGHDIAKASNLLSRYSTRAQRFDLSQPIKDVMIRVFQSITQVSQNITTSSLLSIGGLSKLDAGQDIGPLFKQMQDALGDLGKALENDLKQYR